MKYLIKKIVSENLTKEQSVLKLNSVCEGKMKEIAMDLEELTDAEFKKKYGKSKSELLAILHDK